MKIFAYGFNYYSHPLVKKYHNKLPSPSFRTLYQTIKYGVLCPISNNGRNYVLEIIFICYVNRFIITSHPP
jgi:hypothetical protein